MGFGFRRERISTQRPGDFFFKAICVFVFFSSVVFDSLGQFALPRDGFPYCEPFTSSTPRPNTILNGAIPTAAPGNTDGVLRLTDNSPGQRGYVYIDLPFSFAYGLKFSFEYFAWGGSNPGADGLSVFLFDGDVSGSAFGIGGFGGSLGYAPLIDDARSVNEPGLIKAYMGIGFDSYFNWGNNYEGRNGGFNGDNLPAFNDEELAGTNRYFESIAVRGPADTGGLGRPYKFVTGKRVFHTPTTEPPGVNLVPPIDPNYYFSDPADRFSIGTTSRVTDCNLDGYRKVFVNLVPRGGKYDLTIDMLVNNGGVLRSVNIVKDFQYNFPAPPTLKIGFAASTGASTNYHEIRNVVVEVSEYVESARPFIPILKEEICVGEGNLFEFEVELRTDEEFPRFVRCVQLYEDEPPTPDYSSPGYTPPTTSDCYFSDGPCQGLCNPDNVIKQLPGKGTFTVTSVQDVSVNGKVNAEIKFVPDVTFTEGEATIWYQVTDNYGLVSKPKEITIIIHPKPVLFDLGNIELPTCDGVSDGRIIDVLVDDLVPGFDYEWTWNGTSIGKLGANVAYDPITRQGRFELLGLNLGTYTLKVSNPSESNLCYLEQPFVIVQGSGTPVELESDEIEVCEGTPAILKPYLEDVYNPGGVIPPVFKWYRDSGRTEPLTNGQTFDLFGSTVTVQIDVTGQLTLNGLPPANDTDPETYEFFVEVDTKDNSNAASPSFCPFIDLVEAVAKVTVYPALKVVKEEVPDWCRDNAGEINLTITGGNGPKTFTLFDQAGVQIRPPNTSGTFSGLLPGDYVVEVESSAPVCLLSIPANVAGPLDKLNLTEVDRTPTTCGLDNGIFSFELDGGNLPYLTADMILTGGNFNPVQFNATTNTYTFSGLESQKEYLLEVRDAKGCLFPFTFTLLNVQTPEFTIIDPLDVCEDETSITFGVTYDFFEIQATAVPEFNWYLAETEGASIVNGAGPFGMSYGVNPSTGELVITNLVAGTYTLWLKMSGPESCNLQRKQVDFEIFPLPDPGPLTPVHVSCFGGNDGQIQVSLLSGNLTDFVYQLENTSGVQVPFEDNEGLFPDLSAGTYTVRVKNKTTSCEALTQPATIIEPTVIVVSGGIEVDPTCELENGTLEFTISGGTPKADGTYDVLINGSPLSGFAQTVTVSGSGENLVKITDLPEGSYDLLINDLNSCEVTQSFSLTAQILPEYTLSDLELCLNETAEIIPVIVNPGTPAANPVFHWYKDAAATQEILDGADAALQLTFDVDSGSGRLFITNFTNAATYTFYLKPEILNSCDFTPIPVEVTVYPIPNPDFESVDASCFSGSDGIIKVTAGGSADFTYTIQGFSNPFNTTDNQFEDLKAGTYTILVANSVTGCEAEFEVIVGEPDVLVIEQDVVVNSSCGEENGSIEFVLKGGTPKADGTYDILINGLPLSDFTQTVTVSGSGENLVKISDLADGSYDVSIKDLNACEITQSFSLTAQILPEYTLTDLEICLNETAEFIPVVVNPGTPAANPVFHWYKDAAATQEILDGADAGLQLTFDVDSGSGRLVVSNFTNAATYTFYLKPEIVNSCDFTPIPVEVTVSPIPNPDFESVDASCFSGSDGIIKVTAGGSADFTYTIQGFSNPFNTTDNQFEDLKAGTYTIQVANSVTGCEAEFEVIVGEPDVLLIEQDVVVDSSCGEDNGSIEFVLKGGTPKADGTYDILINGLPLSDFTQTVTVSGSGENLVKISDLADGSYDLLINDLNSCEVTQTFTLTAQILPEYTLTDLEICLNETAEFIPVVVNPGTPAANPVFHWYKDSLATQEILNGADAGLQLTFDVDSGSGRLVVSNFTNAATYTFYLKPEIVNSCDFTPIPVEVTVSPIPNPDFESVDASCFSGSDGIIKVTAGGSADFTYTIQGLSNPFNTTDNQFEDLMAGTYTIRVANSVTGCEAEFEVIVGEPEVLVIEQDVVVDSSCGEDNGSIEFVLKGGTPKADGTYDILINGLPLSDFTQTVTVSGSGENLVKITDLPEGSYDLLINDLNSCEVTQTFSLTAQILPEYTLSDLELCLNETAEIIPVIVNPGTPAANPVFHWYKDSLATQEISDGLDAGLGMSFDMDAGTGRLSITSITNPGVYKFYLKPEILNSCELTSIPVTITVFALPDVTFEVIGVACFGESNGEIKLVTGGDPSYTFTLNTGVKNNTGNFTSLPAGTYEVTIANAEGCEVKEVLIIDQPAQLQTQKIEQTDPTCGDSNGEIVFEILGGTPAYAILINGDPISTFKSQINGNRYIIQDLAPGAYSIAVGDANTCSITSNNLFTLVNNEGVNINSEPLFVEICESGTAQLAPKVIIPPGTIPVFRWYFDSTATKEIIHNPSPTADGKIYQISGTSVLSIQNLTSGSYNYYLRITGPGICTQITEATVTVTDPVVASVDAESITCFGDANGQITVKDFSGGNGTYEFSINGTDWQASPIFPNLAANTYPVSIRDSSGSNGCILVIDTVVEGPSGPISGNTPDIIRASCGLDNGAVRNLQISGGWGNYTFEWRKGNATTGQLLPQGTLTGIEDLAAGVYYLTISDDQGCKATFNYTIGESSDPVYQVVPPVNSCFGTPIIIRPIHLAPNPLLPPAAATEVRWYKDANQIGLISNGHDAVTPSVIYSIDDTNWINPELTINNLPVGTHDFYFYVECTGQEIKIDITVFETPDMVFEATPVTCFGDANGKIKAVSGQNSSYVYQLNGGNKLTLAELEALNLAAGSYTLTVGTPAGCPQTIQLEITSPSAALQLQNLSKIDPGCGVANGKINGQIQGGWAPYTVQIIKNGTPANQVNVPGPTLAINGLTVGDYSLVVTDSKGCVVSSATLTLVDGPTQILVEDQTICAGELATITPQLDPQASQATYTWSFDQAGTNVINSSPNPASDGRTYQINSSGVLTINGLPASNQPYQFYVKASGSGVCPGFTAAPKVRVIDSPTANVNVVNPVCFGDKGSITVNATGGDGTYSYSLDGVNFQASNVFQVSAGQYDLTVKSGGACLFQLPAIQVQGPSAALTVNELKAINSTCNLDNGQISFKILGGYGNYQVNTFKNNSSIGVKAADANGNFVINGLGIGVYTFEVTDSSGCLLKLSSPLNLVEEPSQITVNNAEICEGETGILKPSINSNSPDLSFTWYSDAQGKNPLASGTPAGVTYTVDANGQLSVAGLAPQANPYTYYVLATGTGICGVVPVPATIKIGALPQLRVSNPSIVCDPNGTVDLTQYIEGYNPLLYDYTVKSPQGNNMRTDEIKSVSVSGSFVVKMNAKGSTCFTPEQRILVLIAEKELIANYDYGVELRPGQILTNQDVNIGEEVLFTDQSLGDVLIWSWDFGDGNTNSIPNPKHSYDEKGTYIVKLTTIDKIGCMSEFVRVIQVFDDYLIEIPNAFTPNRADGKNNYFRPYFRGIASMRLLIFNTWGNFIFESTELETQGWDGYYNGVMSPNGNYVYKAEFETRGGLKVTRTGVFILID